MEDDIFLNKIQFINSNLFGFPVNKSFNSIGSNIFIEFGDVKEVELNGEKQTIKEWCIWINNSSWRISKNGKYIVGSGESSLQIQAKIQTLIDKRFNSLQFLSQFLDIRCDFEEEYELETFFNWDGEDQWTIFLSDGSNVGVDFSVPNEITRTKNIAKQSEPKKKYKEWERPLPKTPIVQILYDSNEQPSFCFPDEFLIRFETCAWRLEKDDQYFAGYLDDNSIKVKEKLSQLIGLKLIRIETGQQMDSRLEFENGYIIKTFSCCKRNIQWSAFHQKKSIFNAGINI